VICWPRLGQLPTPPGGSLRERIQGCQLCCLGLEACFGLSLLGADTGQIGFQLPKGGRHMGQDAGEREHRSCRCGAGRLAVVAVRDPVADTPGPTAQRRRPLRRGHRRLPLYDRVITVLGMRG
jgi:hypothetical protein